MVLSSIIENHDSYREWLRDRLYDARQPTFSVVLIPAFPYGSER